MSIISHTSHLTLIKQHQAYAPEAALMVSSSHSLLLTTLPVKTVPWLNKPTDPHVRHESVLRTTPRLTRRSARPGPAWPPPRDAAFSPTTNDAEEFTQNTSLELGKCFDMQSCEVPDSWGRVSHSLELDYQLYPWHLCCSKSLHAYNAWLKVPSCTHSFWLISTEYRNSSFTCISCWFFFFW